MMLSEVAPVSGVDLPIREFADHLHLGSGFADDGSQDQMLETFLRAAIGAVETRIGKALLSRQFEYDVTRWRDGWREVLPVAPVISVDVVKTVDALGAETLLGPEEYRLVRDGQRPCLQAVQGGFPSIPLGGNGVVLFTAGYGAAWTDVPVALRHAVILLASHYYENRAALSSDHTLMPFGVLALLDSHRDFRLGGQTL